MHKFFLKCQLPLDMTHHNYLLTLQEFKCLKELARVRSLTFVAKEGLNVFDKSTNYKLH